MKHEEETLLSALLDGELEGPERVQLQKHLSRCVDCKTELESLRKIKTLLAQAPKKSLPENWRAPLSNPALTGSFPQVNQEHHARSPKFMITAGIAIAISLIVGFWMIQGTRILSPNFHSLLSQNSTIGKELPPSSPTAIVAPSITDASNHAHTETP